MKFGKNRINIKLLIKSQLPVILSCLILELLYVTVLSNHINIYGIFVFVFVIGAALYTALRYGLKFGLLSNIFAFIFVLYLGSNGRFTAFTPANIRGIILFMVIITATTTIVGWLRGIVDNEIAKEVELREIAEEERARLASILNQIPIGILIADKNAKNIQANSQMDTILGRRLKDTFQLEDFRVPLQYMGLIKTIKSGKPVKNFEMDFIRPDKKKTYIRINANRIFNKKNKPIAWVSAVMDVTQQKELEGRKDEFINLASHELKTPITSIKIYMDVLEKEILKTNDKKTKKIASDLQDQINRLSNLVFDLLDVSRIQTGKLAINKEEFRLDNLIDDILEVIKRTTTKHDFIFKRSPVKVIADRYRIYQVITNLLTNAIKYSPRGGKIIVSIKRRDSQAVVGIQDFGVGIEKDQQNQIFEKLYQVKNGSASYPGLGLGLYLSKTIINRNKGRIWVESEKDKGSTFYFTLPLNNKKIN